MMDHQFENSAMWPAANHNLDFAMQEYLSLHDQREELCQRLHELCPSSSSSSTTTTLSSLASTTATSPSVSPTRSLLTPSSSRPDFHVHHASQNESLIGEVAAGKQKLYDVNEGMKRALTELLNCEAVRQDRVMRMWVQTRLLETEKELRRGRRRRSSAD
ncbi:hypothetical protein F4679DRAFT_568649 [Xylaria curta]|nr:hypothetical protein F4679DRAFT_568649 [Xylaria curta]